MSVCEIVDRAARELLEAAKEPRLTYDFGCCDASVSGNLTAHVSFPTSDGVIRRAVLRQEFGEGPFFRGPFAVLFLGGSPEWYAAGSIADAVRAMMEAVDYAAGGAPSVKDALASRP